MSPEAKVHLDAVAEHGYTVLRGGVNPGTAGELLAKIRRLNAAHTRAPDSEQPFLNRGHDVLYNLQREDLAFTRVYTRDPLLGEILRGLLNDPYYKQIPGDRPNFL